MGTWGIGIMQDDVAADVEIAFEDALAEGLSVAEATRRLLEDPIWDLDDEDDGPVTYLALAALQLQHGALDQYIRGKALGIIASGAGPVRWEDAVTDGLTDAADNLAARTELLERFKVLPERGACTHDELREITLPQEHTS